MSNNYNKNILNSKFETKGNGYLTNVYRDLPKHINATEADGYDYKHVSAEELRRWKSKYDRLPDKTTLDELITVYDLVMGMSITERNSMYYEAMSRMNAYINNRMCPKARESVYSFAELKKRMDSLKREQLMYEDTSKAILDKNPLFEKMMKTGNISTNSEFTLVSTEALYDYNSNGVDVIPTTDGRIHLMSATGTYNTSLSIRDSVKYKRFHLILDRRSEDGTKVIYNNLETDFLDESDEELRYDQNCICPLQNFIFATTSDSYQTSKTIKNNIYFFDGYTDKWEKIFTVDFPIVPGSIRGFYSRDNYNFSSTDDISELYFVLLKGTYNEKYSYKNTYFSNPEIVIFRRDNHHQWTMKESGTDNIYFDTNNEIVEFGNNSKYVSVACFRKNYSGNRFYYALLSRESSESKYITHHSYIDFYTNNYDNTIISPHDISSPIKFPQNPDYYITGLLQSPDYLLNEIYGVSIEGVCHKIDYKEVYPSSSSSSYIDIYIDEKGSCRVRNDAVSDWWLVNNNLIRKKITRQNINNYNFGIEVSLLDLSYDNAYPEQVYKNDNHNDLYRFNIGSYVTAINDNLYPTVTRFQSNNVTGNIIDYPPFQRLFKTTKCGRYVIVSIQDVSNGYIFVYNSKKDTSYIQSTPRLYYIDTIKDPNLFKYSPGSNIRLNPLINYEKHSDRQDTIWRDCFHDKRIKNYLIEKYNYDESTFKDITVFNEAVIAVGNDIHVLAGVYFLNKTIKEFPLDSTDYATAFGSKLQDFLVYASSIHYIIHMPQDLSNGASIEYTNESLIEFVDIPEEIVKESPFTGANFTYTGTKIIKAGGDCVVPSNGNGTNSVLIYDIVSKTWINPKIKSDVFLDSTLTETYNYIPIYTSKDDKLLFLRTYFKNGVICNKCFSTNANSLSTFTEISTDTSRYYTIEDMVFTQEGGIDSYAYNYVASDYNEMPKAIIDSNGNLIDKSNGYNFYTSHQKILPTDTFKKYNYNISFIQFSQIYNNERYRIIGTYNICGFKVVLAVKPTMSRESSNSDVAIRLYSSWKFDIFIKIPTYYDMSKYQSLSLMSPISSHDYYNLSSPIDTTQGSSVYTVDSDGAPVIIVSTPIRRGATTNYLAVWYKGSWRYFNSIVENNLNGMLGVEGMYEYNNNNSVDMVYTLGAEDNIIALRPYDRSRNASSSEIFYDYYYLSLKNNDIKFKSSSMYVSSVPIITENSVLAASEESNNIETLASTEYTISPDYSLYDIDTSPVSICTDYINHPHLHIATHSYITGYNTYYNGANMLQYGVFICVFWSGYNGRPYYSDSYYQFKYQLSSSQTPLLKNRRNDVVKMAGTNTVMVLVNDKNYLISLLNVYSMIDYVEEYFDGRYQLVRVLEIEIHDESINNSDAENMLSVVSAHDYNAFYTSKQEYINNGYNYPIDFKGSCIVADDTYLYVIGGVANAYNVYRIELSKVVTGDFTYKSFKLFKRLNFRCVHSTAVYARDLNAIMIYGGVDAGGSMSETIFL